MRIDELLTNFNRDLIKAKSISEVNKIKMQYEQKIDRYGLILEPSKIEEKISIVGKKIIDDFKRDLNDMDPDENIDVLLEEYEHIIRDKREIHGDEEEEILKILKELSKLKKYSDESDDDEFVEEEKELSYEENLAKASSDKLKAIRSRVESLEYRATNFILNSYSDNHIQFGVTRSLYTILKEFEEKADILMHNIKDSKFNDSEKQALSSRVELAREKYKVSFQKQSLGVIRNASEDFSGSYQASELKFKGKAKLHKKQENERKNDKESDNKLGHFFDKSFNKNYLKEIVGKEDFEIVEKEIEDVRYGLFRDEKVKTAIEAIKTKLQETKQSLVDAKHLSMVENLIKKVESTIELSCRELRSQEISKISDAIASDREEIYSLAQSRREFLTPTDITVKEIDETDEQEFEAVPDDVDDEFMKMSLGEMVSGFQQDLEEAKSEAEVLRLTAQVKIFGYDLIEKLCKIAMGNVSNKLTQTINEKAEKFKSIIDELSLNRINVIQSIRKNSRELALSTIIQKFQTDLKEVTNKDGLHKLTGAVKLLGYETIQKFMTDGSNVQLTEEINKEVSKFKRTIQNLFDKKLETLAKQPNVSARPLNQGFVKKYLGSFGFFRQPSATGTVVKPNHYSEIFIRAVREGNVEKAVSFLNVIEDVNAKDSLQMTALHYAVLKGNRALVETLVTKFVNIDINVKDKNGMTPLGYAVLKGNTSLVQILLDRGALPSTGNTELNENLKKILSAGGNIPGNGKQKINPPLHTLRTRSAPAPIQLDSIAPSRFGNGRK